MFALGLRAVCQRWREATPVQTGEAVCPQVN